MDQETIHLHLEIKKLRLKKQKKTQIQFFSARLYVLFYLLHSIRVCVKFKNKTDENKKKKTPMKKVKERKPVSQCARVLGVHIKHI